MAKRSGCFSASNHPRILATRRRELESKVKVYAGQPCVPGGPLRLPVLDTSSQEGGALATLRFLL